MCVCVYVYVCVCMCVYMCVYVCVYISYVLFKLYQYRLLLCALASIAGDILKTVPNSCSNLTIIIDY